MKTAHTWLAHKLDSIIVIHPTNKMMGEIKYLSKGFRVGILWENGEVISTPMDVFLSFEVIEADE